MSAEYMDIKHMQSIVMKHARTSCKQRCPDTLSGELHQRQPDYEDKCHGSKNVQDRSNSKNLVRHTQESKE